MMVDVEQRIQRAKIVREWGTAARALDAGALDQFQDLSLSETLVLGLLNQGVRSYVGVFGHGSTDVAEVLRVYQSQGVVRVYNVHHETEASHAAAQLRLQYGERAAVVTSIGPGALHAFAGSLLPQSNGLGVYYLFGEETTHNEGPNMQQIARREQDLFLRMTSAMGPGYTLTDPRAVSTALKWGYRAVFDPAGESPFFLLLPMNLQGSIIRSMNIGELPRAVPLGSAGSADESACGRAVELIRLARRITVKVGGGARSLKREALTRFLERTGAVYVHGPQVPGLIPDDHERNMTVGGSKGSISGNFAMSGCELAIVIGARGVCQWDSSGTAWANVENVININSRLEDALQYNRTVPLVGDCAVVLDQLNAMLREVEIEHGEDRRAWISECRNKREEWDRLRRERIRKATLHDEKRGRPLLTQPAALDRAITFADRHGLIKIFDAGDVQANGFQLVRDREPRMTYTDTGSSYMGYAVSALLASAMTEHPQYPVAFTGDGSFLMSPQILSDAVEFGLRGMIVLLDNRRMAAISGLQQAQYGHEFATDDSVEVDYVQLANAFRGVRGIHGGYTPTELDAALETAFSHRGLSLVHVEVYSGIEEEGGLGAYGKWNVGNWCDQVQREKHEIGL